MQSYILNKYIQINIEYFFKTTAIHSAGAGWTGKPLNPFLS